MALTLRAEKFANEYAASGNGTDAATRAGYSEASAHAQSTRLLKNAEVVARIREIQGQAAKRTQITHDMVLERWWQLATADPNELTQLRREPCRFCHGVGHAYQWVDVEEYRRAFMEAMAAAHRRKRAAEPPSDAGGFGFTTKRDPHPECPSCNGEGLARPFFADTRKLKGPAALLFAGVRQTRDGIEIKMHDQARALENVARHLGMWPSKVELTGAGGGPVQTVTMTPDEFKKARREMLEDDDV